LTYQTIKPGDTLPEIATANQTTVGDLMRANRRQIGNRNLPGDGKWNIGSFSYSNERGGAQQAKSPDDADRIQLSRLYKSKNIYVAAMNRAGLDLNNALLATVYLDMFNQSPTSAQNLLKSENLKYLKENGITIETMKEWRFRGFVNAETGQRWRYPNGSIAGGNEKSGLAKIAHQNAQRKYHQVELLRLPAERELLIGKPARCSPRFNSAIIFPSIETDKPFPKF
jgi:hypothetical protein